MVIEDHDEIEAFYRFFETALTKSEDRCWALNAAVHHRRLLLTLDNSRQPGTNEVWISWRVLAERYGRDRSRMNRCIQDLIDLGMVARVERGNGTMLVLLYRNPDGSVPEREPVAESPTRKAAIPFSGNGGRR